MASVEDFVDKKSRFWLPKTLKPEEITERIKEDVVEELRPLIVNDLKKDEEFVEELRGEDGSTPDIDVSAIIETVKEQLPKPTETKIELSDEPDTIIEKIHKSDKLIKSDKIDGFDTMRRNVDDAWTNIRRMGTTIGGQMFVKLKSGGRPAGQPETLNISGATISSVGNGSEVNISIGGFEGISKNLNNYDSHTIPPTFSSGKILTITYITPDGNIVKTFSYNSDGTINTIVLSGSVPTGIPLTKTFYWSGGTYAGATYA